jgi:hypothetical protein
MRDLSQLPAPLGKVAFSRAKEARARGDSNTRPTDYVSVATRFNSPDLLKRSTEAPDLGFRNRRFQDIPFRFKKRFDLRGENARFTFLWQAHDRRVKSSSF